MTFKGLLIQQSPPLESKRKRNICHREFSGVLADVTVWWIPCFAEEYGNDLTIITR